MKMWSILLLFVFSLPAVSQEIYWCDRCQSYHQRGLSSSGGVTLLPQGYQAQNRRYTAGGSQARNRPPVSNKFNYRRAINPTLQARAQREANLLASQYSFRRYQHIARTNPALGHPIGVPPGYIGGTGCSAPTYTNNGRVVGNRIHTCEPDYNAVLVAEAFAYRPQDDIWYSSRIWRQR